VATNSLQVNLKGALDEKAKTLLGADLVLSSRRTLPKEVFQLLKDKKALYSTETMFNSMAFFPKSGDSRLVVIRGLGGAFPYYGEMVTEPHSAALSFRSSDDALLEESLFHQFGLNIGEKVRIGQKEFRIAGKLIKNAGEIMGTFFAAPRVYIGAHYVDDTNLIKTGSLRRHKIYIKEKSSQKRAALEIEFKAIRDKSPFRIESVKGRREMVGTGSDNLNRFLNLASFVVLLLGGVGVASSIHIYIQKKASAYGDIEMLGGHRSARVANLFFAGL